MANRDLDKLLADLGVDPTAAPAPRSVPKLPEGSKPKHALDTMPSAFSAVPMAPSGQRKFNDPPAPGSDSSGLARPGAKDPGMSSIYDPEAGAGTSGGSELATLGLGEYLLREGAITEQQLSAAHNILKTNPGRRLSDLLMEQGCEELKLQRAVAHLARVPFEQIDLTKGLEGGFDGKLLQRLTVDFCREFQVIPLRTEGSRTVVGAVRPDAFLYDELRRRLGVTGIKLVVVTGYELRGALELAGDKSAAENMDVQRLLSEVEDSDVQVEKKDQQEVDLEKEASESPVIKYVNFIIQSAVKEGASDIHIEPSEKAVKVRFRIDGELYDMMQPPANWSAAITSRLKIMANLDISERRLPQDGRIRCSVASRKLDLRMSTLPCTYGEKTVMRILDTRSINVKLEDLGFDDNTLNLWRGLINAPHGIVLVTGPTGSGKTTTLYSSLRTLDKTSMNISTVEDPVEYHLDGVTQCQMHDKIGMTFAKALKALLRQDPDVIMLGEIRDHETALTAVQAALTGHLVLSTLHTNDAPSSVTRLVNIGLEPFLVAAAVNGVLAQRLLRKLCKECKQPLVPQGELAEFMSVQGLPTDSLFGPKGCDRCRKSGYSGRVGIYELLVVDDQLRDHIVRNPNVSELRRTCSERGMISLRQDGLRKAVKGLTSVEEVLRVTEATI